MTTDSSSLPVATVRPGRGWRWVWLVPLAALLFVGALGYRAWTQRGIAVSIEFEHGHGLEVGDDVRYRGITVGQVTAIELETAHRGILVRARLTPESTHLASAGTQFWIVRPRLDVAGIAGIETIVGPRYISLSPGDGARQRQFVGLVEPPIVQQIEPGDLEIVLQAPERGSLRRGAPVLYRQIRVGTVLSVGLSSDGSAVEARLHVERGYVALVRERTRFWDAGGLAIDAGISGISVEMDSLANVLSGGVALATPPEGGDIVLTGHRFEFASEPDPEWLEWEPTVVIGSALLPPGLSMPTPLRAKIKWKQDKLLVFTSKQSRQGWVLQTPWGLVGPADLLLPPEDADKASESLEVAGARVDLTGESPRWTGRGLALVGEFVTARVWPEGRFREPVDPEDCVAVADPAAIPLALSAGRLKSGEFTWRIDPAVPVPVALHGATVVARSDGAVIGMLLVDADEEDAVVALLPPIGD